MPSIVYQSTAHHSYVTCACVPQLMDSRSSGSPPLCDLLVLLLIHSDSDQSDGSIKYTISGEGAGTIFIIDQVTGDIHATERLDREEKAFYTLRAQARDRLTDEPLEPESEFVIKVQDINDSEPKFLEGPYVGSVAELSPVGKRNKQMSLRLWLVC
ncbi:hypothetical protein DNTS_016348 [Danionella cerebrum]|uniref:Cadherin domain-containing protein n=1 Tax=Danionella cerebrum TaxID=2873325 RepID=A0A553MZD2_9TELE|nr:hypothetical protein DNTS_016348 [Danionella translucida]